MNWSSIEVVLRFRWCGRGSREVCCETVRAGGEDLFDEMVDESQKRIGQKFNAWTTSWLVFLLYLCCYSQLRTDPLLIVVRSAFVVLSSSVFLQACINQLRCSSSWGNKLMKKKKLVQHHRHTQTVFDWEWVEKRCISAGWDIPLLIPQGWK